MLINPTKAVALSRAVSAPSLIDINNQDSIKSVASTLAYGVQSYYTGNVTDTPETIAIFPAPVYWWEAGAAWAAMLDYSHFTGDTSYDNVTLQALMSQVGPTFNFMDPLYYGSEGNDDQAFWAFTVLDAAERNFPQPNNTIPPWLTVAENIWNSMVARWDNTSCGGGLRWQIFADNVNGLDYKNSVSNGGFFQMSARLARATNNDTYERWAEKVWDWSTKVQFIDQDYVVHDGASSKQQCNPVNPTSYSYSQGIYMYGAAIMFNYTGGNSTWGDRASGLLKGSQLYFSPFNNATDIMFEESCETLGTCDTDMKSFKGYLSRFMAASTQMMPSLRPDVQKWLDASAIAAGKACSGGENGTTCGEKWYVGGYDGNTGLGQQLSALETVQGLLAFNATPPYKAGEIKHVTTFPTATASPTPSPTPTEENSAAGSEMPNCIVALVAIASAILVTL
ncbi:glycoside hydrolase family 76 protein [Xylariaceae sp. FL0255]|nr:glycoside hydrolase family 76 protein [Xylariaceae sp. FL0255]